VEGTGTFELGPGLGRDPGSGLRRKFGGVGSKDADKNSTAELDLELDSDLAPACPPASTVEEVPPQPSRDGRFTKTQVEVCNVARESRRGAWGIIS